MAQCRMSVALVGAPTAIRTHRPWRRPGSIDLAGGDRLYLVSRRVSNHGVFMSKAMFFVGSCNRVLPYFATANGRGIGAFRIDTVTGEIETLGVAEGIDNPTYLATAPDGISLSATSEVLGWNEGTISACAIDAKSGALIYLNKQPTRGNIAAHLSYDATGRFVAVANYSMLPTTSKPNQSVVICPRSADGALAAPVAEVSHSGIGLDRVRQERSHAHSARWTPNNRFLVVADLGTDQLVLYKFDAATGALCWHSVTPLPPGSGPRHIAFHPARSFVYSANELSSSVASLSFDEDAGILSLLAVRASLPEGEIGHSHCSAIKVSRNGRHLFVGNRGHDSIGCFDIDPASGIATLRETVPAGGKTPRDLEFDPSGNLLAVANQDSDRVNFFSYDSANGELAEFGTPLTTGTPTAVTFYPGSTAQVSDLS